MSGLKEAAGKKSMFRRSHLRRTAQKSDFRERKLIIFCVTNKGRRDTGKDLGVLTSINYAIMLLVFRVVSFHSKAFCSATSLQC